LESPHSAGAADLFVGQQIILSNNLLNKKSGTDRNYEKNQNHAASRKSEASRTHEYTSGLLFVHHCIM
jgi:hypothetical protein